MLGEAVVAEGGEAELSVAGAEEGITRSMHHTHPLQVTIVRTLCRIARSVAMMIITMEISPSVPQALRPSVPQALRPSVPQSLKMRCMMTFQFCLWSLLAGTHY